MFPAREFKQLVPNKNLVGLMCYLTFGVIFCCDHFTKHRVDDKTMYGLIFELAEEWIIEDFGIDTWHAVKKKAGCHVKDQEFLRRSYYPDEDLFELISVASDMLGVEQYDALVSLGRFVTQYLFQKGYDELLRCQGSTLRQWLSNLNAMHDHVQRTFPGKKFQAPVFWCEDCEEVEGSIQLHYYSLRGTFFVPLVVGIVEELASFHFEVEINMKQLCLQGEGGASFTSWRISAVNEEQRWKLSPRAQTDTISEDESVDFSTVPLPSKCPFSGNLSNHSRTKRNTSPMRTTRKCIGKPDKPLDPTNTVQVYGKCPYTAGKNMKNRAISDESSSSSGVTETTASMCSSLEETTIVTYEQSEGISLLQLQELFPFHVLVNRDFSIVQVGHSLPTMLDYQPYEFQGKHIETFLEISRPVMTSDWDWKALQKLADQHFFLTPKTTTGKSLFKKVSMEDSAIRFKASMVDLPAGRVMFVMAPDVGNVAELNAMGLTMSDLPLSSFQRDAVFLGEYIHQESRRAHKLDKLSKKLTSEKNLSNTLLYNMLPKHVADELRTGKMVEPMYHEKTTLFYSDIEGFTKICNEVEAWDVIDMLNQLYSVMDFLAAHFKLYKLETIGDAYLCCAGLEPDDYHAERVANFALAVVECVKQIKSPTGSPLRLRIGIHTGSCTSGVVGTLTPRYCLFGDFVNTTARHESTGAPGKIHCSSACFGRLKHFSMFGDTEQYNFTPRGLVDMKGKGESYTYWLESASDQNKAANNQALKGLSKKVGKLLGTKSWKMRKYFRRNGELRDETASLAGSMAPSLSGSDESDDIKVGSSHSVSSEQENHDECPQSPRIESHVVCDPPGSFSCDDSTDHDEVDELLHFVEEMPYKKAWSKLELEASSQHELQQKVTDIMIDALSECITCSPAKINTITKQLTTFITKIASQYNDDNRYHNFQRACHVLLSADFLWQKIRSDGIIPGLGHDSWDRFILVLASLILDVQHEGVSNSQLKTENHLIYQIHAKRGSSYQERYSLQHSLSTLEDECPDLYDEISFGAPRFCNSVTRLVLATDMECLEERLGSLKERLSNPCMSDRSQVQKNVAAMELVMMVANVGHYSQDSFMHWTQAQFSEQMDAFSSKRGLDPRLSWCSSQIEVMKNVVIPLIVEFESLVPRSSCDLMGVADRNFALWKERGFEIIKDNQVLSAGISDLNDDKEHIAGVDIACGMLEKLLKEVMASHGEGQSQSQGHKLDLCCPTGGNPIEDIAMKISMKKVDQRCLDKASGDDFKLPPLVSSELREFVSIVSKLYRPNPFHSFDHALNVSMISNLLLQRIEDTTGPDGAYGIVSDPLARFAVVFSALVHDVDHTGVPNGQLAVEQPKLASTYKNKSIAEQHSIVSAWDLLMDEQFRNLQACLFSSEGERERLRKLMINCVMATDIFDKELKAFRNSRWEKAFLEAAVDHSVDDMEAKEEQANIKATVIIEHIIQASDVAHTMQDWNLYTKWNERLFHEMYAAYKEGRADKDPSVGWYWGELWFFDNWVVPLATKLKECGVFGMISDEFLVQAQKNRKMWETQGEEICRNMLENIKKSTGCGSSDDDENSCVDDSESSFAASVATAPDTAVVSPLIGGGQRSPVEFVTPTLPGISDPLLVLVRSSMEIKKLRTLFASKAKELLSMSSAAIAAAPYPSSSSSSSGSAEDMKGSFANGATKKRQQTGLSSYLSPSNMYSDDDVTTMDGGVDPRKEVYQLVEEVESITRVVSRFEARIEKGVKTLLGIAKDTRDKKRKNTMNSNEAAPTASFSSSPGGDSDLSVTMGGEHRGKETTGREESQQGLDGSLRRSYRSAQDLRSIKSKPGTKHRRDSKGHLLSLRGTLLKQ